MSVSRPIGVGDLASVLALNNVHGEELSLLDEARLARLLEAAYLARAVGDLDGFLLCFDQSGDYDSPNFLWFRERFDRFAYVDRIAIAAHARGRGLARALYRELFEKAAADGHELVACEVNLDPPNQASDAFHAALGFEEVGQAGYGPKTVRYFTRRLQRIDDLA